MALPITPAEAPIDPEQARCPGCRKPATRTLCLGGWAYRCTPCSWDWGIASSADASGALHDLRQREAETARAQWLQLAEFYRREQTARAREGRWKHAREAGLHAADAEAKALEIEAAHLTSQCPSIAAAYERESAT